MPFGEINVNEILEQKFKNNSVLESEFKEIENELDVIAQIIKVRNEKGLSQKEVADMAGLTQQMISRIETKEFSPNLRNLVKVINALDLKLKVDNK
jgi:DNA-binding XRE family transcriptional regulator